MGEEKPGVDKDARILELEAKVKQLEEQVQDLRGQLGLSQSKVNSNETISDNSTKEIVLEILGKPDIKAKFKVGYERWAYGSSIITFNNTGNVIAWKQVDRDLKIKDGNRERRLTPEVSKLLNVGNSNQQMQKPSSRDGNMWWCTKKDQGQYSYSPSSSYNIKNTNNYSGSSVSENGSYYGQISKKTGRAKTVHVNSYTRKDGTRVKSHYRSPPRRR
ncbi:MAG: hypothetical protein ABIJ12_13890 [bacterium]